MTNELPTPEAGQAEVEATEALFNFLTNEVIKPNINKDTQPFTGAEAHDPAFAYIEKDKPKNNAK